MTNPHRAVVAGHTRLIADARALPLGGFPAPAHPGVRSERKVLLFSPHPDDECIIGGLALRLQREAGARVVNVAVTQGSNKARQAAR